MEVFMPRNIILTIFTFISSTFSSIVSVQNWDVGKSYNTQDIVIYQGKAYLAMQNVSAGYVPTQSGGVWKNIANYSDPKNYKHDSAYTAGDITRYNNEVYVARNWSSYTYPNKNDQWGAWIFINNYAPLVQQPSGPIAKLPPDPGAAGKKTILGIDSDGDGVRDDIQIAVTKLIPDDPYARAAAMFWFAMISELWKVVLENPNKPFDFYYPYFQASGAGSYYYVRTKADDLISSSKCAIFLYNTKERFLISEKIDSIANGKGFQSFRDNPKSFQDKYDGLFQNFYQREKERQK
jgi:hypothetical protein